MFIKCVDSTIKCIDFQSFYYVINLTVILSFMIFNKFDYMFFDILLVEMNKIIYL